jgi:hypothetical protein
MIGNGFMGAHGLPLEEWRANMTKYSAAFEMKQTMFHFKRKARVLWPNG